MEAMDIDDETHTSVATTDERGVKRTWLELNEKGGRQEKLARSIGNHKLTIHCIRVDTYACSVMNKDNPTALIPTLNPEKKPRLTSDEVERVIQTFTAF